MIFLLLQFVFYWIQDSLIEHLVWRTAWIWGSPKSSEFTRRNKQGLGYKWAPKGAPSSCSRSRDFPPMRKRLFDLPLVRTNWIQALLWPHLPLWSQYHNVCELNCIQACIHSGINVQKSLQLSEKGGSYHPILQMEKWKFSMMTKLTQSHTSPPMAPHPHLSTNVRSLEEAACEWVWRKVDDSGIFAAFLPPDLPRNMPDSIFCTLLAAWGWGCLLVPYYSFHLWINSK